MYDLGDRILMVASDRISTYDVVHPTPIPDKGAVLTGLSAFWFGRTGHIVTNHYVSATEDVPDEVRGRAMAVRKLRMLPVECVVRGYITGSGWKDYQATGSVSGIELPPGPARVRAPADADLHARRPRPTRATTRRSTSSAPRELVGDRELMARVRDVSIALYRFAAEHARERGVILADTKFEFGLDDDGELVVGDEVLTPDSSRYWPADGYAGRAAASRASTSSTCATGPRAAAGTRRRRRRRSPTTSSQGTRARYVEAYERITGEPFAAWLSRTARVRARVLIRPKAGILDPQGIAVERALPALGFAGVSNVHVGRLVELDVEDAAQLDEMCRQLLANPLIEDYEIVATGVKFGVVRFPGSCDDVDAQLAASRVGEAVLLWHADRDLQGVDAVDRARRLLLRRLPARRRDRPLRAGHGGGHRLRARRRAGARDLQRLPGAVRGGPAARARCCPTTACASSAARSTSRCSTPTPSSRARATPGERLSIPCKHTTGRYWAPDDELDASRPAGRSSCATRAGENPNGSARDIAGVCNEAGNVMGLMPHPEHAVDELCGGSADGLKLFASAAVGRA